MSRLINVPYPVVNAPARHPFAVAAAAAVLVTAFLIAPGDIATKTHAALHGLCAQRPSHSLQIGGSVLPLDARMTGIYLGAAATLIWLVATGRFRANRLPPVSVLATLVLFVLALAVDGFNALLVDLRFPNPYAPSNMLRLATGVMAGTSLGVALGYLFASSIWARGEHRRAVVAAPAELVPPLVISGAVAALAQLDLPLLFAPFAIGLLLAAITVFWVLGMVILALMSNRGWTCRGWGDLTPIALTALLGAIAGIGALAVIRMVAEQLLGLPKLT